MSVPMFHPPRFNPSPAPMINPPPAMLCPPPRLVSDYQGNAYEVVEKLGGKRELRGALGYFLGEIDKNGVVTKEEYGDGGAIS